MLKVQNKYTPSNQGDHIFSIEFTIGLKGSLKPTHVAEQAQQAVLDSDHEYCTRDFASDLGASAALVNFPFQLLIGIW